MCDFATFAEFPPRSYRPGVRYSPDFGAAPRAGATVRLAGEFLAALRPEATVQSAFNYHLAALFPWFDFSARPTDAAMKQNLRTKNGAVIPSMLDLVLTEPLLLGYEPGELMIPGTDIPLILPPDRR